MGCLFYSIVLSVFIQIPHCFDYNSIVINLKSESVRHLTWFFFKIVLAIEALSFTVMAQLKRGQNLQTMCEDSFFF